jgi:16S rRNA (cytidine1402-2'-O)-methyltransferase
VLTLVPTPIGNLEDITLRSIRVLKECDLILAEDTRHTGKLLQHLGIHKPMQPYHAHNEHQSMEGYIAKLSSGMNIALVTDAGTPGISDPAFLLVRTCVEKEIEVQCLPGPTAFVPALAASGLPCDKFFFEGFLPHKKGRQTRLKYLTTLDYTFVLYESPFRITACLAQLIEHCGADRPVAVARELSKMHESFTRGKLGDVHTLFESGKEPSKGEIVVVVGGLGK